MSYFPPPQPSAGGQSGFGETQQQQPTYDPSSQSDQQQHASYLQEQQLQQYLSPFPPLEMKSRKTLWIVLGVISAVVLIGCIVIPAMANQISHQQANIQQPAATHAVQRSAQAVGTPSSAHMSKWVTIQTFSGTGKKKTGFFNVSDNWKLVWKCNPASSSGSKYNVNISVFGSNGKSIDPTAVKTICQSDHTGDSSAEHHRGQMYLNVASEGAWTIQIQELQ